MMKKLLIVALFAARAYAQVPTTVVNGSAGIVYPNDTTTGTTLGYLVKLTSTGNVINATTTDTTGIIGCAALPGSVGTSGLATVATSGTVQCVFDNTPAVGDYVENSPTVAGQAHDYGTTESAATTQCVGRVAYPATAVGTGVYNIVWGKCGKTGTGSGPAGATGTAQLNGGGGAFAAKSIAGTGTQIQSAPATPVGSGNICVGDGAGNCVDTLRPLTALGGSGQLPVMNAGATAYVPVSITGDSTLSSSGVMTNTGINGVQYASLGSGFEYNTTSTGIQSIATNAQFLTAATAGLKTGTNCNTSNSYYFSPFSGTCVLASTGSGTVSSFAAPSGSWPTWLVPTVTNSTTTPSLAVAASAIPNAALANSSVTVNGATCTLGLSCTTGNSGEAVLSSTTTSSTALNPNVSQNTVTLTTNFTFTLATPTNSGLVLTDCLTFVQTGAFTVSTTSSAVHGLFSVGTTTTAGSNYNTQCFRWIPSLTTWESTDAGRINN